jgi:hypothetical protein
MSDWAVYNWGTDPNFEELISLGKKRRRPIRRSPPKQQLPLSPSLERKRIVLFTPEELL